MVYFLPDLLSSFATTSAIPRRSSLGRMVNQSTMLLMFSIGSLILILALLILFHQNANATKGYMLRTLEWDRSRLLLDEERLKMKIAQEQSLKGLQADQHIELMIPAKNIQYVKGYPSTATSPTALED